ncbi:unnamed protein product [Paramecium sonneborni]|uniref:Uncharacterized protein n=1 Tax=Paramecium sonneborni TaxID=65129 RepID=A0A8S1RVY4_9CILI|nr:unnamed protein product [Paramecium sonneborni]
MVILLYNPLIFDFDQRIYLNLKLNKRVCLFGNEFTNILGQFIIEKQQIQIYAQKIRRITCLIVQKSIFNLLKYLDNKNQSFMKQNKKDIDNSEQETNTILIKLNKFLNIVEHLESQRKIIILSIVRNRKQQILRKFIFAFGLSIQQVQNIKNQFTFIIERQIVIFIWIRNRKNSNFKDFLKKFNCQIETRIKRYLKLDSIKELVFRKIYQRLKRMKQQLQEMLKEVLKRIKQ